MLCQLEGFRRCNTCGCWLACCVGVRGAAELVTLVKELWGVRFGW